MNELIEKYLDRGFGSMNKTDFEVAIFHYLMEDERFKNMTDYQLCKELKITKTKVSELRYKADLYYWEEKENEYKDKFKKILEKAKIQNSQKVLFSIPDKSMRQYFDDILIQDNRFSDSSFNSNMVSIYIDDLAYLMSVVYSKEELDDFVKKVMEIKPELAQPLDDELTLDDKTQEGQERKHLGTLENVLKYVANSKIGQAAISEASSGIVRFGLQHLFDLISL